jgi:hypothetical protein
MRKSVLTGVVAFLLGAAGSPKAANDNETRAMLCARFAAAGGTARIHEIRVTIAKIAIRQDVFNAEANALEIMQRTLCR